MATQYPTALDGEAQLDTSIAPTATLGNPSHSDQHENVNGAVQALEAKVGIGSSAAASSTDQMVLVSSGSTTSWGHRGVAVFADSAARDAAISSPVDGVVAYTQDSNQLWVHDGSSWVEVIDLDVFKQYVTATSSARPAASEGRLIWETDTDRLTVYDGSNWVTPYGLGLVQTLTLNATTSDNDWTESVTLASDRRYRIEVSATSVGDTDASSSGALTVFQLQCRYAGTEYQRPSFTVEDTSLLGNNSRLDHYPSWSVQGTGSAADITLRLANQFANGAVRTWLGASSANYSRIYIYDIGPA